MSIVKAPPLLAETERTYVAFNRVLFNDSLSIPVFTLNFDRKFSVKFFQSTYEFALGSRVSGLTAEGLLADIVHEMVHVYNHQCGVTDWKTNDYHTGEFVRVALSVGLYVAKHRTKGWGVTSLGGQDLGEGVKSPDPVSNARLMKVIEDVCFNVKVLQTARLLGYQPEKPRRMFLIKWTCNCPAPHNCIRSGRRPDGRFPLRVRCEDCDAMFKAELT